MGPDRAQLEAAQGRAISDLVAPGLRVLFCGINPGLWSGAVGHHFARPGNRFWKVLHGSGFTDRLLHPSEQQELLALGIGISNLVDRASATAAELTTPELRAGAVRFEQKVLGLEPVVVAFLGLQAYRVAHRRPRASLGRQPERVGASSVWLLPNPSGAQARYQMPELISMFEELRLFAGAGGQPARRPIRGGARPPE